MPTFLFWWTKQHHRYQRCVCTRSLVLHCSEAQGSICGSIMRILIIGAVRSPNNNYASDWMTWWDKKISPTTRTHTLWQQAASQTYTNTTFPCVPASICGVTWACECSTVCVLIRLFHRLFVSDGGRANPLSVTHPPSPHVHSSPLPRHTATEMLPEIFNSVAAVNKPCNLGINVIRLREGEEESRGMGNKVELQRWMDGPEERERVVHV